MGIRTHNHVERTFINGYGLSCFGWYQLIVNSSFLNKYERGKRKGRIHVTC